MSRLKKTAELPDNFKLDVKFFKDENEQWRFKVSESYSGETMENAFDNPKTSIEALSRVLNERIKIWNF